MTEKNNLPELPKGWVWTKVGDIFVFEYGKSLTEKKRDVNGSIPVYGSNGMVGYHSASLTKEPCMIIGRKGAAGKVHLCKSLCWAIDTTYYVYTPKEVELSFAYYLLSKLNLGYLDKSTAIPGLNRDDAYALIIPLSPLPEQHRIVAKIEELFTRLDAGIEALKKIKTQIKRYRQAVLKYAFEGKLTAEWREKHKDEPASVLLEKIKEERKKALGKKYKESLPVDKTGLPTLPGGWIWTTLDNLFINPKQEIVDGPFGSNLKAAEYMESGVPILRLQNIDRNFFIDKNIKYINKKKAEELIRHNFLSGDIILTKLGVPLGKACIVPMTYRFGIIVADIVRLRIKHELILREYIVYCINADIVAKQLEIKTKGTTRPRVNLGHIRELDIPLPPFAEQVQIVSEIERRFSVADEIEKVIDQSLKQAERLRQSILKRAFEGKLVPQDPSDEPAEKLLEGIKAERESREAEGKKQKKGKKKKYSAHGRHK